MPTLESVFVAARRKLLADTSFQDLLGVDVGKDSSGDLWDDGWVFRSYGNNDAPQRDPRNTGLSTVTMDLNRPWGSPNQHNTLSFRRLGFTILSDRTRQNTDSSLSAAYDAELRCSRVADCVIDVFNDVANVDHNWPNSVYIISCILYEDLFMETIPNNDGLVQGTLSFALELG